MMVSELVTAVFALTRMVELMQMELVATIRTASLKASPPPSTEPMTVLHRIISAVADETGEPPTHLPPLHDTIDPDALERLVASADTEQLQLSFTYAGYRISVYEDGTIDYHER
ncbi:HalOD1 output domain-containing protein [Natrinema sp. 1APR25-10V2]|uniref:HalOD1 output domain-containing protein n=1 Tax=Natrinema sp. 1APR25-10V2 TaxID=2951081 RepID=UPI002874D174|nr:HalOD1 output domain-containing protein [Natrinema sp. 1APR25-10V2]MDS0477037.1 hypothetical protein [Natrinema sp. 1APR25-10V2]